MTDQRAQSETLGFVLVFALMVASIGIVYTAGFAGLQDARDVERVNNAERAFEVLADNLEDITQRGAPSRATEIKISDARLYVDDPIEIRVDVPADEFNTTHSVRPIVFDADTGENVVYEQGAALRTRGDNGTVFHESILLLNDSQTSITVVQTRLSGNGGVGGSDTVLVRADHSQTVLEYKNDTRNLVWFNVTSPRAGVWRQHLAEYPDVTCESDVPGTASCYVTTDRVQITVARINVALE